MSERIDHISVLGAGTMGAGIAQVAAQHGCRVMLADRTSEIAEAARERIASQFGRLIEKGRLRREEAEASVERIEVAQGPADHARSQVVIEAVIEDATAKATVLKETLEHAQTDVIIATNTSALSVTALGESIDRPRRTVGMHFFNPAPIMKLVEVVRTEAADPSVIETIAELARSWGKTVAITADFPGFIVNHVARPYYLEAFRILEDGQATPARIDAVMRELGGFRMGPLELTDLIGQDVNTATTRSVWKGLDHPPLLAPSTLQESLVTAGHLGRKSQRGVYRYDERPVTEGPTEGLTVKDIPCPLPAETAEGLRAFAIAAASDPDRAAGEDAKAHLILARILCALILQARAAHAHGVAEPPAIDTAMRAGVNYPRGPFEWAEQIGLTLVDETIGRLAGLDRIAGGAKRFRASTQPEQSFGFR